MLAKVLSSAVIGIEAYLVEVEVDITPGLPSFTTVGLPEAAVKESKERVKSAINNSGYTFPDNRITVNLAPADIKKNIRTYYRLTSSGPLSRGFPASTAMSTLPSGSTKRWRRQRFSNSDCSSPQNLKICWTERWM